MWSPWLVIGEGVESLIGGKYVRRLFSDSGTSQLNDEPTQESCSSIVMLNHQNRAEQSWAVEAQVKFRSSVIQDAPLDLKEPNIWLWCLLVASLCRFSRFVPLGGDPGWPRTLWRDYRPSLVWEHLEGPPVGAGDGGPGFCPGPVSCHFGWSCHF